MNNLTVFEFNAHKIRTTVIDNEIWFVAKDICSMLDIGNSRMALDRLSESMKGVSIIDTLGGPQEAAIVNEPGLYKLIFTSRKPEAEEFSDYVAEVILPAIRKTGQYQVKPMSQAELIAAQAQLMLEQDRRISAVEQINRQTEEKISQIAEVAVPVGDNSYREAITKKIRSTCYRYDENYQNAHNYLYMNLESDMHCDLDARIRNKRTRLARSGALKSSIEKVNKLDVIADDPALMRAFDLVVQRWAVNLAARR